MPVPSEALGYWVPARWAPVSTARPWLLRRSATERTSTGTFATTNGEADDPHHSEHDGRYPQQVNGKSCAKENEYQKSQNDDEHDLPFFCVPGLGTDI